MGTSHESYLFFPCACVCVIYIAPLSGVETGDSIGFNLSSSGEEETHPYIDIELGTCCAGPDEAQTPGQAQLVSVALTGHQLSYPMDPSTFSEGTWTLQTCIAVAPITC